MVKAEKGCALATGPVVDLLPIEGMPQPKCGVSGYFSTSSVCGIGATLCSVLRLCRIRRLTIIEPERELLQIPLQIVGLDAAVGPP